MGTIRLVTFSFVTDTLVKVNLSPEGYNAKYWIKLKPNFDNLERNETISNAELMVNVNNGKVSSMIVEYELETEEANGEIFSEIKKYKIDGEGVVTVEVDQFEDIVTITCKDTVEVKNLVTMFESNYTYYDVEKI